MLALLRDIGRKRPISIKRMRALFLDDLGSIGAPLADEFRQTMDVEEPRLASIGFWACYIYSMSFKDGDQWPPEVTPLGQHLIEIEQALKEPTLAWQRHDMNRCVDLLGDSPILATYLWPEVVSKLRNATSAEEVSVVRGMVMLEIFLSWIACWDARIQSCGNSTQSMFGDLFPDFSAKIVRQPNALFFDWLEAYTGKKHKLASQIHQISKRAKDTDIASTKRQLRRWRSGAGFPSVDVLDAMFRDIYGDRAQEDGNVRRKDWDLSWSMAMATKRINFLMPILAPMSKFREPSFPFGYETVQAWRESRYKHWYSHWLSQPVKRT